MGVALSGLEMGWIYFSQGFALCYCILPLRGLNSPPLSFEKERGNLINPFSLVPFFNLLERGNKKG